MQNKETLTVNIERPETDSTDILICTPSNVQYVDDVYFREKMHEDRSNFKLITHGVHITSI